MKRKAAQFEVSAEDAGVEVVKPRRTRIDKEKLDREQKKIRENSICIKLKKKLEKSVIEEILMGAHSGIEKICFPRQKVPRFVFVRCSSSTIKTEVWDAIKKLENYTIGPLYPSSARPPKPKTKKNAVKKTIDPLTLVLEMIPKELSTEEIQKEFPDCKKANRFNARRCYLHFNSLESAFEAFERLTSELVLGHNISARYQKVTNITKKGKKIEKEATRQNENELTSTPEASEQSDNSESNDGSEEEGTSGEDS